MRSGNRYTICGILPIWLFSTIDPNLSVHGRPDKHLDTLIFVVLFFDQSRSITSGSFLACMHACSELGRGRSRSLGGFSNLEMTSHLLEWLHHFVEGEVFWSACGLDWLHLGFQIALSRWLLIWTDRLLGSLSSIHDVVLIIDYHSLVYPQVSIGVGKFRNAILTIFTQR
jgi:hypothetical protein